MNEGRRQKAEGTIGWSFIPITKNHAILSMRLQLLSNNNGSVIFVNIIGIKPRYLLSFVF
ncbi:hypothetical protein [Okeania sp. SIO2B3]|uniref:hypothetical protein n=1 Tax=Okeania sp. SIO2B3 TaxID=2607784 RepID=UPI0013BED4C0|nr:hypothetical protein [Okeania sp. SIO2B3]NET42645.1 hypothetical protein [Okeania sp. SIO2B3]